MIYFGNYRYIPKDFPKESNEIVLQVLDSLGSIEPSELPGRLENLMRLVSGDKVLIVNLFSLGVIEFTEGDLEELRSLVEEEVKPGLTD